MFRFLLATALCIVACSESDSSGTDSAGGTPGSGSTGTGGSAGAGGVAGAGGTAGSGGTAGGGGTMGSCDAPPPGVQETGIISATALTLLESEATVAAGSDGSVATAFIAITGPTSLIGTTFSSDGGATFGTITHVSSPGMSARASDPVLTVDGTNNYYLTWIGYRLDATQSPTDMHVYVTRAAAGSGMFGPPVEVTDPAEVDPHYDKPWITVTNQGMIVVGYEKQGGDIIAARSTDAGSSWTRATVAPNLGQFQNLAYPCSPATGDRIYVVHWADGAVELHWSDDQGLSWPSANITVVSDPSEMPAFEDPTCVADGSDVWVSYGLADQPFANGTPLLQRIRIAHSSDGGASISARYDAHDPAAGPLFLIPQLALEPPNVLHLVYHAGKAEGDAASSLRWARSSDGGVTWAASQSLDCPLTFTGRRDLPTWLGDYLGLFHRSGTLHVAHTDNASGFSHINFLRTPTQ